MTEEPVRVLIADDHPVFRDGLAALLNLGPGTELAGAVATGAEAVELARAAAPDVVLMDLRMPGIDGIEATRAIVADSPHVAVIVLTMIDDDDSVFAALRAGARGYLLKGADAAQIRRAVASAAAGEAVFGAGIAARVLAYFSGQAGRVPDPFPQLTDRQREVLELVAQGRSNAAIAARLYLSQKTVRNNVSSILVKLQVADRAEAIVRARDAGLGTRHQPRALLPGIGRLWPAPAARAAEVLAFAERIVAREEQMATAVLAGEPVTTVVHDAEFPVPLPGRG